MNVLEISAGYAAGYAGLLLAELAYHVDRIDLSTTPDDPFIHRDKHLIGAARDPWNYDVVIEDVGARGLRKLGLSYRRIHAQHPDTAVVSLSPFGQSGPYRNWHANDLIVQALGGVMHVTGYEGEPPLKLPGETAAAIAGLHGATAAITAVHGAKSGAEQNVHIDISAQDTLMHHWTRHVSEYAYAGTLMGRWPRNPKGIHGRHTVMAEDGWLYLLALRVPWQDVAAFLGLGRFVEFRDDDTQPWEEMESAYHDAIASRGRYDWFTDAAGLGWTFAPVEDPFQLMANAQSRARSLFETHIVDGEEVMMPRLPFQIREDEATND